MAVFTGTLYTDPPVDLAKLANDGRITLVSATEIKWDGSVNGLSDGTNWKVCKPSSIPNAANTATDLNGTALGVEKVYDVFLNYSSVTSASLAFSRWAVHTAGSSARNAAYAAGTAYAIGDRVTYSGRDYTCIQAGTGKTPTSEPTYWVDNGTSVTGDYHGLYKHDGVLVSHNSDAGKKLRWLGNIYTYNNSGTVNFKDEETLRLISNFYNKLDSYIKTVNASDFTVSSTSFVEFTGSNTVGRFLTCQTGIHQQSRDVTTTGAVTDYCDFVTWVDGSAVGVTTSAKNVMGAWYRYSAVAQASVAAGYHTLSQAAKVISGAAPIAANSSSLLTLQG